MRAPEILYDDGRHLMYGSPDGLVIKKASAWIPMSQESIDDLDPVRRYLAWRFGREAYRMKTPATIRLERKARRRKAYNAKISRRFKR